MIPKHAVHAKHARGADQQNPQTARRRGRYGQNHSTLGREEHGRSVLSAFEEHVTWREANVFADREQPPPIMPTKSRNQLIGVDHAGARSDLPKGCRLPE